MKLFLDDERMPYDVFRYLRNKHYEENNWEIVKDYDQFIGFISSNELPTIISFDHDLHNEHYVYAVASFIPYDLFENKTGYHCLSWLLEYCDKNNLQYPEILIHTMNITGSKNMRKLLDTYSAQKEAK